MSEWARFPRTKFVNENTPIDQLDHLMDEINEVEGAVSAEETVIELFDVIHSAETLIRMMEKCYGMNPEQLKEKVIQKNKERGYYG